MTGQLLTTNSGGVAVYLPYVNIDFDSLGPCVSPQVDVTVLLIGTGARLVPVPAELRARLRAHGIGVEAMDTGAACRTFNVLLTEERAVAAALIAV